MNNILFYIAPLVIFILYIGVPVAIIFFLKKFNDMVKLTKEKNEKLDQIIHLLEDQEK